jgi:hypothetical protein
LVSHHFVQGPIQCEHGLGGKTVKLVEQPHHLVGGLALRQSSESTNIYEKYRQFNQLPARGSQLISNRAKIGVLPGGSDLNQPEEYCEDSEKGGATLLAPLVRRKPVKNPPHPWVSSQYLPDTSNRQQQRVDRHYDDLLLPGGFHRDRSRGAFVGAFGS